MKIERDMIKQEEEQAKKSNEKELEEARALAAKAQNKQKQFENFLEAEKGEASKETQQVKQEKAKLETEYKRAVSYATVVTD